MHLEKALRHMREYLSEEDSDYAVSAQHLRAAIREVGQLSGKVSSEQILDVIFADFCVGK
jgi:tRNA modification GTPase